MLTPEIAASTVASPASLLALVKNQREREALSEADPTVSDHCCKNP